MVYVTAIALLARRNPSGRHCVQSAAGDVDKIAACNR